ncbi:MAG: ATP-binding protein, partial [Lachnospiraceae bacterium]|nr:ATP-binding protein [Lachnospiraceae bacterium]
TDIPDEEIFFDFDRSQMKRVFENIISNSLKYTEPGTTIFVSLDADENRIEIILGDDGPGVSEALKEKLFDPFSVGDQSRKSGKGTGLGLSIAKKIVEAHGGTIKVIDSYRGKEGLFYQVVFYKRPGH